MRMLYQVSDLFNATNETDSRIPKEGDLIEITHIERSIKPYAIKETLVKVIKVYETFIQIEYLESKVMECFHKIHLLNGDLQYKVIKDTSNSNKEAIKECVVV